MTYNASIPQPGDAISQSQPPILNNFGQLNLLFGQDHVSYTDSAPAQRGFHKKITFRAPLTVDPNQISPIGSLYTKTVTNTELFYQNGTLATDVYQLTNTTLSKLVGSGALTNGLQIRGDFGTASVAGVLTNFSPAFPTACVAVVACASSAPNQINVAAVVAASFLAKSPQGACAIYWIAIGY